ncbi:MAG: magnesium transporter, partial [Chloroflexi bacterium]|nr:magnesium transporter [Chloroflexota bacterium]
MEQSQKIPPGSRAEDQSRPSEEVVHELVRELERLLESGQRPEVLDRFGGLHPVDQGEVLAGLPRELRQSLLAELDASVVAGILEFLEPGKLAEMVGGREPADLAQVLDLTGPDVAVDLLRQIPEEKRQETLEAMGGAAEVTELLQYQDDTAGGLMTPDYPVVMETTTTPNALDQLRLLGSGAEDINSVLVVDGQQRLVGSLSITRLALARPNFLVGDIMDREINSVTAGTDQEECARMMQRYNLSFLPVVDGEGRFTGVILAEHLVDVVVEEATEDMFRIASVGGERIAGPLSKSL